MGRQLGLYLRERRKEKGMSVNAVAQVSGISKGMLDCIEFGKRDPSYAMVARFAAAVGIEDLTPVFRVYATELATEALAEIGENNYGAANLLAKWLSIPNEINPYLNAHIEELISLSSDVSEKLLGVKKLLDARDLLPSANTEI